jgi:hypothetical protein
MMDKLMNCTTSQNLRKRSYLLIIISISILLVFLGMRNTFLSKDQRPKPRPRAVVVTAKKLPQMVSQQAPEQSVVAVCSGTIFLHCPSLPDAPDFICNARFTDSDLPVSPPSRASPRFSARLT